MKKGTAILREKNRREVLRVLRKNKGCSRKEIVNLTNVTKNTISLIIEDFIEQKIVTEDGIQPISSVGRPQISLSIIKGSIKIAAVSLEDDKIVAILSDYGLNELERVELPYLSREDCIDKLKKVVQEFSSKNQLFGVAVAVPGIVDSKNGIIKMSIRLGFKEFDLKSEVQEVYSGKILIINSVKALALLYFDEASDKTDSLFYIRIRRGIGGAFINKNVLLSGHNWAAGEIGQLEIENSYTERCTLEELVSDISSRITTAPEDDKENLMKQLVYGMSQAVSTVIYLYDPEKILFDCPFNVDAYFKNELIRQLKDNRYVSKYYKENLIFSEKTLKIEHGATFALINDYELMEEY